MSDLRGQVTRLLDRLRDGDRGVIDDLLPIVYGQLKVIARGQLKGERGSHTLNTTALVHEAYLKLIDQNKVNWQDRAHFMAVAALSMRRILIDYARSRLAEKRGGGEQLVTLSEELHGRDTRIEDLVALDESLVLLQSVDERQAEIVQYHFFGGLTHQEISEVMKISIATVQREWRVARAWLSQRLKGDDS